MCNPRRIRVSASRQLDEAWQREVSRCVQLSDRVVGEAHVRQNLDSTIGRPALLALESALAAEGSGWVRVDSGYRFDVEGGYVLYLVDEQALEIVATLSDEVHARGQASQILEGRVTTSIEAEGVGQYYSDGYAGRTEESARREAEAEANRILDRTAREQMETSMQASEADAARDIESEAYSRAQLELARRAETRRAELADQARHHLQTVGLRGRQVFHRVLAQAYRDAILAYARLHGAEGVNCTDDGEIVEIEFRVRR